MGPLHFAHKQIPFKDCYHIPRIEVVSALSNNFRELTPSTLTFKLKTKTTNSFMLMMFTAQDKQMKAKTK